MSSTPVKKPLKKTATKSRRLKARKRRELAVLRDRLVLAQADVAEAIMKLKFHEIQLARFLKSPNISDLVEAHKDSKDTYERLFGRMVVGHKAKKRSK